MADKSRNMTTIAIQLVLAVVIAGLSYYLYLSITGPWEVVEQRKAMTEATRKQMTYVRASLLYFKDHNEEFPVSLDSMLVLLKADSAFMADMNGHLRLDEGVSFNLDGLYTSPRTNNLFEYSLNDTSRIAIYLLQDPDSDDHIGSEFPDITMLNAASWE